MRKTQQLVLLAIAAVVTAAGADDTTARLGKAAAVLGKMTESGGIPAGELAGASWSFPDSRKEPSSLE